MTIAPDKPIGTEPGNPWHEETDATGQRWRVYDDGTNRRLKIGGTIGPGAPKKEVREKWLELANKPSLSWAMRILSNEEIADDAPVKLKAIEFALRFGLGTQDEVVKLDDAKVPAAVAQVLGNLIGQTMTLELAHASADQIRALLGLQAP